LKIIFLDVDGVLINKTAFKLAYENKVREQADPPCVEQLNRVVAETGAYIVMSSCWRIGRDIMEIRDLLRGWGVVGTTIDKTPHLPTLRGNEIQAWLNRYAQHERYGPVESFVILDDDSDMAHLKPSLVRTWIDDGLTKQKADEAIAMLNAVKIDAQKVLNDMEMQQ
jgi:hypothetical protein